MVRRVRSGALGLLGFVLVHWMAGPARAYTETEIMIGANHNVRATIIAPDLPGHYPGIMVLHSSFGLLGADSDFARHLADQGYVCLVPAYAIAYGIQDRNRREAYGAKASQIYDDLVDGVTVLRNSNQVAGGKIGVVGFSMGAFFAVWMAGTEKVDAAVSYYGALQQGLSEKRGGLFEKTFSAASSPVLILHGEDDTIQPVAVARHMDRLLSETNTPHEIHIYPGARHLFDRADSLDQDAAKDAWARTVSFFGHYLE